MTWLGNNVTRDAHSKVASSQGGVELDAQSPTSPFHASRGGEVRGCAAPGWVDA